MKKRKPNPASARLSREPARAATPGRLWRFRVMALLLPVLLAALAEFGLRLAGYGYPTGFFRQIGSGSQAVLVNSDTFSLRFFPPELARWPEPIVIPAAKPPGTTRIFIFGESAAMGDPQPAYGASRFLEVLLRRRFPERKFEVVNTGITAINSHVILPIARECARQSGDVWIVYAGNNEMVGPFGAATVFGRQSPPLGLVRFNLALQKLRLGQLAAAVLRRAGGSSAPARWEGMRMFLHNQIAADNPRRAATLRNFESNLRDILRAGLDSGAKVILTTVSVNLKDCPPFASLSNSNLPPTDRAQFGKLFGEARAAADQGDNRAAAQLFEGAARLDPGFAEVHYRWGDCLRRETNAAAPAQYQMACDLDALPFRADSQVNGVIRRVGGEFPGRPLTLCDAEGTLAKASPQGIPGQELFFEHVHFNLAGNYLLGRLWADEVARSLAGTQNATNATEWASQETCEQDLGVTLWNRCFLLDLVIERMRKPPLESQFNNPGRLAALEAQLRDLRVQRASTNAIMRSGEELVRAIQRLPQDHWLYEGLASLYEAVGDFKRAGEAYRKVHELLPQDFYGNLQLGRFLGRAGQLAEAERLLQQASRQRPNIPDPWVELGNVCMGQAKYSTALGAYERAAELRPGEASYAASVAAALSRLNRHLEAIAAYRQAIQLKPDSWEPHFELAGELAGDNQLEAALSEYTEAVRLNPNHVVSRINLGVVFFRQGRLQEAIKQFQNALQLDPTNAAAAEYLRQATARAAQPGR